jgi:hypothetical protein
MAMKQSRMKRKKAAVGQVQAIHDKPERASIMAWAPSLAQDDFGLLREAPHFPFFPLAGRRCPEGG